MIIVKLTPQSKPEAVLKSLVKKKIVKNIKRVLPQASSSNEDIKFNLENDSEAKRKKIQFDGLICVRMMYEMIIRGLPSYEPEYIWSCFVKDMKVTMRDVTQGLQILLDLGLVRKDGDKLVKGDAEASFGTNDLRYTDEFKVVTSKVLAIGGILASRSSECTSPDGDGLIINKPNIPSGYFIDWCLPMTKKSYIAMINEIVETIQKYESLWDPSSNIPYEYYQIATGIIQGTNINKNIHVADSKNEYEKTNI